MNTKEKIQQASEPAENYQIGHNETATTEVNPELEHLLEIAKQESAEGTFFTHKEVRKRVREKFPFIK
jgi:hypothetical protein